MSSIKAHFFWKSPVQDICNSTQIYLFIQSFVYINIDPWIFILYLVYNAILLYLLAQIILVLATENSFSSSINVCMYVFLIIFLFSRNIRCSRLTLYFFCPSPKICHFSWDPWFFWLVDGIHSNIWELGWDFWLISFDRNAHRESFWLNCLLKVLQNNHWSH